MHYICRGELKKLGFPPTFEKYSACSEEESLETEDNVFLRIGSIDLSGGINLELTSRTMSKKITTMFFDFEKLDPLEREIRKHAEDNLANIGRRGCTTTEVYTIIQKYFEEVIKHTITDTLGDIVADGGKQTKGNFDKLVGITKASFSKYVEEAGEWTGEQVEKTIEEQLDTLEKSLGKLKEEHRSIFQLAKKVGESNYIQDRLLEKENESKSSASKANHEL
jgi:predicted transcriptional regulator